jgi:hypothetical protein
MDLEKLHNIEILPSDLLPADAQLSYLGNSFVLVLSSAVFLELPISRQIRWIFYIFQISVRRYVKELDVIKSLIQYHVLRLFQDPELRITGACLLTEAVHGMNWADSQSLFDMRDYDRFGVQPFRKYVLKNYSNYVINPVINHAKTKRKIIYLCHYADLNRGNALGPMLKGIMKSHKLESDAEIICYCVQWADQEYIDTLASFGIEVKVLAQEINFDLLDELRDALRNESADVVISDVASPIATWLFIQRVAPTQIYLDPGYPHWNIPELDWTLLPGKSYQNGFKLSATRWSSIRLCLNEELFSYQQKEQKSRTYLNWKDREYTYGMFARLVKVSSEWTQAVERILINTKNSKLLIVGTGNPQQIEELKSHPVLGSRVTLINEFVSLKEFQSKVDVLLDTFPFAGGLVCREFIGYGIPTISMLSGEWDEMLLDERDPRLLAKSVDEYVGIATRLFDDTLFYEASSDSAIALSKKQNSAQTMVQDIEDGIEKAITYHQKSV